jgi:hypothetical protein
MKSTVEDIKSLHWDRERGGGAKSSVNVFFFIPLTLSTAVHAGLVVS